MRNTGNLLLDEQPLIILPKLAEKIGLNESIVLQQFHYWLERSTNVREGYKWIYNTYEEWQKQFPFWSVTTLKRTITKLEKEKYLIVGNYNQMKIDRTKWYRIDYDFLEKLNDEEKQSDPSMGSKWSVAEVNLTPPITRDYSEITTDIKTYAHSENASELEKEVYKEKEETKTEEYSEEFENIWSQYPKKADKKMSYSKYKSKVKKFGREIVDTGILNYIKENQANGTDKQFYKGLKTFLHGDCFKEYQEESKEKRTATVTLSKKPKGKRNISLTEIDF